MGKVKLWQCKDEPDQLILETPSFETVNACENQIKSLTENGWVRVACYETYLDDWDEKTFYLFIKQKGQNNEKLH